MQILKVLKYVIGQHSRTLIAFTSDTDIHQGAKYIALAMIKRLLKAGTQSKAKSDKYQ
jgi:hypothetical protein